MPTIVQTQTGVVTGLWGAATIRGTDGRMRELKLGDTVNKGDVLLTTQDGIVQLTLEPDPLIPDPPEFGLDPGPDGDIGEGLRVARITEGVSPDGLRLAGLADGSGVVPRAGAAGLASAFDTPTATSSAVQGPEDSVLPIGLAGRSPAGTVTAITVTTLPGNGTLFLPDGVTPVVAGTPLTPGQAGNLVFRPDANFNGSSGVGFTVTDTTGRTSEPGTVQIVVAPVNDAPIAVNDTSEATSGRPLVIAPPALLVNDRDIDGDTLTIRSVQDATNGSVALVGGNVVFTPAPGYTGPASFTYTISDGAGGTSTATVTLNVLPPNTPPVANPSAVSGPEDAASIPVTLAGTDPDGSVTAVTVTTLPPAAQGTLLLGPGGSPVVAGAALTPAQAATVVFVPAPDFNGAVSVPFTVTDNRGDTSPVATATIDVTPVNDAPRAANDVGTTAADTALTLPASGLLANDRDVDGNPLSIVGVDSAVNGSVALVGGNPVFTPAPGYVGPASFVYTVSDGQGGSATARVDITVTAAPAPPPPPPPPVNTPPVATPSAVTGPEDSAAIPLPLSGTDPDVGGSVVSVTVTALPPSTQGVLLIGAGGTPVVAGLALTPAQAAAIVFVPAPNFNGAVDVPFTVTDNQGAPSAPASASITVTPVNDAPTAGNDAVTTGRDVPITIIPSALLANDTDPDSGPLTITSVQSPVNGTVAIIAGNVVFTPAPGYSGPASFTYTVSDGAGGSATATVAVNVGSVDAVDDPVAAPYTATLGSLSPTVTWTGPDSTGQPVSYRAFNADGTPGAVVVTPGFAGDPAPLGVAGTPRPADGFPAEVEYDNVTGRSEVLEILFNGLVNQATVNFGAMGSLEAPGGERGAWVAIYQGTIVAQGVFLGTADLRPTLAITTGPLVFDTLRLTALPYDGATPGTPGDSSDFTVTGVSAQGPLALGSGLVTSAGSVLTVDAASGRGLLVNDSDPEANPFAITAVNGAAFTSGGTVTLASGALLTINADGTFAYNPNGQFAGLAGGQIGQDTFTYTITDSTGATDTATVRITVVGTTGTPAPTATALSEAALARSAGAEAIAGGPGDDVIVGTPGDDRLAGSAGADVFAWSLADRGSAGAPPVDTVTDFSFAPAAAGGDALDLRDLLVGATGSAVDLERFLDFNVVGGNTEIRISSSGGFAGGTYDAGVEDQRIVLEGVNIRDALGLAGGAGDGQILQELLARGKLLTDAT